MSTKQIIAILFLILLAGGIAYINIRFLKNPKKRRKNRSSKSSRDSDKRKLSRHEKKSYQQAIELHRRGKSIPAAQLLESIGMMRESISILENAGHIKEAASILIRMQKPNRAGVIFARHKKWQEAAQCFIIANMPLEAAKCFKEVRDLKNAAEYFAKAQRFEDAADCHYELKAYNKACKIYARLNTKEKYINSLLGLKNDTTVFAQHQFDNNEIEIILDHLSQEENEFHPFFLQAFSEVEKMTTLILRLLDQNRMKEASLAFKTAKTGCAEELLIQINYVKEQAPRLAELFKENQIYDKAGIVYSRLENFAAAGEVFEKAGDLQTAIIYYDKVPNEAKVKELTKRLKSEKTPSSPPPPPKRELQNKNTAHNPFSLSYGEEISRSGINEIEEKTEIIDLSKNISNLDLKTQKFEDEEDDDTRVVFQRLEFLDDLTRPEKDKIWSIGSLRRFNQNQEILKFNDEPEGIVFLLKGQISISIGDRENPVVIKILNSTESFGESWVLADQESSFMALATTDCHVFIVPKENLIQLFHENGEIARKMYKKYTAILLAKIISHDNQSRNKIAS